MPTLDLGELPNQLKVQVEKAAANYRGGKLSYDGRNLHAPDDQILFEFCKSLGIDIPSAAPARKRPHIVREQSYQAYVKVYSRYFDGSPFIDKSAFQGFEETGRAHYRVARMRIERFGSDARKAEGTLKHFEIAVELAKNPEIKKDLGNFLRGTPATKDLGYNQFCVRDENDPKSKGCGVPVRKYADDCWNCGEIFTN